MTKGDILLIVSQIYCVGGLVVERRKRFLYTVAAIELIMYLIFWGVK